MDSAWRIGEAIYERGVKWASGLWMLYACGHLDDFAGVVGVFLTDVAHIIWVLKMRDDDAVALRDDIWHMVATAKHLSLSTRFDSRPEVASLHKSTTCDIRNLERVLRPAQAQIRLDPVSLDREHLQLLWRQRAKQPWLNYNRYRSSFNEAFKTWSRERQMESPDEFARSAIALARAPDLPLWNKERGIRIMLSHMLAEIFVVTPDNALPLPPSLDDTQNDQLMRLFRRIAKRDFDFLDGEWNDEYSTIVERLEPLKKLDVPEEWQFYDE